MTDRTDGRGVVVLSLNVPALERLLGGDSEWEVQIRRQVAEQFVKNHFSVRDADTKKLIDQFKQAQLDTFNQLLTQEIGEVKKSYAGTRMELTPAFKTQLDAKVKELVKNYLTDGFAQAVQDAIDQRVREYQAYADSKIKDALKTQIDKAIQEGIATQLKAAAAAVGR